MSQSIYHKLMDQKTFPHITVFPKIKHIRITLTIKLPSMTLMKTYK